MYVVGPPQHLGSTWASGTRDLLIGPRKGGTCALFSHTEYISL